MLPYFSLLCAINDFKAMADIAKKLGSIIPMYDCISSYCWYMIGKYKPQLVPGALMLADMFTGKIARSKDALAKLGDWTK